jgi:hypothetical protein
MPKEKEIEPIGIRNVKTRYGGTTLKRLGVEMNKTMSSLVYDALHIAYPDFFPSAPPEAKKSRKEEEKEA